MIFRALAPSGVSFHFSDFLSAGKAVFSGRKAVDVFRNRLASFAGMKSAYLFSSGRAALSVAFKALHKLHPQKTEVVIPAYTSFSVPSAVVNAGLKVRLYDIDPHTMSPDTDSLKQVVGEETLCVVVCHLFGYPTDMDAVLEVTGDIPVIDDAAQAMNARYKDRKTGTMGDIGLFSLSRGKNISAVDGGILVIDNPAIADALRSVEVAKPSVTDQIKTVFMAFALWMLLHPLLYWIPERLPFLNLGSSVFDPDFEISGLSTFQVGLGMSMFERLEQITDGRARMAETYMRMLDRDDFPRVVEGAEPVYLRLPLLSAGQECVDRERGVVGSYPTSLSRIPELRPHLQGGEDFPGADSLAAGIVTLPTHAYVSYADIKHIAAQINAQEG